MSSSFEKINYNLRPNKCVERKMMSDAIGRLSLLDHLENYRYIGFGSPYFADFSLFHKNHGINDLISIEKEAAKKGRFEFNIPYVNIQMKYGLSHTILPNLELSAKKNILWLDYDDRISDYMFSDIQTFFTEAMAGSFFIISVNVEEEHVSYKEDGSEKISQKEFRINELINRVGKTRIPYEFMSLNMNTKNSAAVTYEMITRQIATSLISRNGTSDHPLEFKQVFNFFYRDNAAILTIGGILFDKFQEKIINKMDFKRFPFYCDTNESYKIQCPNLTVREVKALDKALPDGLETVKGKFKSKKLQAIPLIQTDITNYAKIYRYYPNFIEAGL